MLKMIVIYFFAAVFLAVVQDAMASQEYPLVRSKRLINSDFLKLGIANEIETDCEKTGIKSQGQFCNKLSYMISERFHQVCHSDNIGQVCKYLSLDTTYGELAEKITGQKISNETRWHGLPIGKALIWLGKIPIVGGFVPRMLGIDTTNVVKEECKNILEEHLCKQIKDTIKFDQLQRVQSDSKDSSAARKEFPELSRRIAQGCDVLLTASSTIRHDILQKGTPDVFCQELKGDYVDLCEEAAQLPCSELGQLGRWICKKTVGQVFCSPKKSADS